MFWEIGLQAVSEDPEYNHGGQGCLSISINLMTANAKKFYFVVRTNILFLTELYITSLKLSI